VMNILYPTFAYIEDGLKGKPESLSLCGFGDLAGPIAEECEKELGVRPGELRSRFGEPGQENAGLLGFLEETGG